MRVSDPQSPEFIAAEAAARWCVRLCEGQMTSTARVEFTRWLTSDPRNRASFDRAVAVWGDVNAVEASPELLELRVEALESLRRAQLAHGWQLLHSAGTRWVLAASVVIAIFLGIGVWRDLTPRKFSSEIAERRTVPLADGSMVSLDASSAVLVRYTATERTLHLLRGRAKFAVAKDPRRPFWVHAGDRKIVATGTEFSVEIVQKAVRVILYEGHVTVVDSVRTTPLSAGQELISPISRTEFHIQPVDAARSLSWESGQLEFVDEPLAAAVERVNRYTLNPLSISDSSAADLRVSGVFTAGDTRAFIEGVTAVYPLIVRERNGQEVLGTSERGQR
jgi:transmembrane sensor